MSVFKPHTRHSSLPSNPLLLIFFMQIETPDPNPPPPTPSKGAWLFFAGFGLLALSGALHLYDEFTSIERAGGSMRIHWLFAIIYRALGKFGVVAPFAFLGGFLLLKAYRRFFEVAEPKDRTY